MKRRIFCIFLVICMTMTLFPAEALSVPEDNGGSVESEDASEAAIEEASEAEPVVTTDAVALMPVAEESAGEEPVTEKLPPVWEEPAVAALMDGESGADNQGLIASGTCGSQDDNLTWTLDSSGLLTVSGKGDMANYRSWWESSPVPPWNAYLSQITAVAIEPGVTSIGSGAFYGFSGVASLTLPDTLKSIGSAAFAECASLKNLTIPGSVKSVTSGCFQSCTGLESVTLSEGVSVIDGGAFYGCSSLANLSLPNGLVGISGWAFANCASLETMTFPDGVGGMGDGAFSGCTGLKSVTFPDSLNSISTSCFSGCTALTELSLPDNMTDIGWYAFQSCSGLKKVKLPKKIRSIGNLAFRGCSSLEEIELPTALDVLADEAFAYCTSLKKVKFYGDISIVSPATFANCTSLETVIFADEVTYIRGSSMFGGCTSLTSLTLPKNLKNLELNASNITSLEIPSHVTSLYLFGCTGLTSITIPDGVRECGFYSCTGLTSITLPDSVTSIGRSAFSGCTGLTSVTIPNSVTSIGEDAFYGCTGLTSITIPEKVTSIENSAFSGCTGLTSVTIPNSVTSIGNSVFNGCTGLTSITISDGVTSIGESAFSGCTGLTSITIPDGVTSIGEYAFSGCAGLTSITIPDGVTEIGYQAFSGCTGLASVMMTDSVTDIRQGAFANCESLKSIALSKNLATLGGTDEAWWYDGVFENCSSLTSVTVPDSVTSLGAYAFKGCTGLTSFQLPDNWPAINGIFSGCTGLTSVTIPDGVTSIGDSTFEGCVGLASVTIPNSVTSIGYNAFNGCAGLTSITIPHGVTSIKSGTFDGCTGLSSVTIPNGATSIESSTFSGCTGLTSITIPDSVTSISYRAFYDCTGLTSITIPDSVTSIEGYAFSGCTGLSSVTIPDSVTSIEEGLFQNCTGLTAITIPDSVTSVSYSAFSGCTGLTSVTIPDRVTSIQGYAFQDCTGLTSITIPDGVTSIGYEAFKGCTALTSITIPDSVTSIGYEAFYGCTALTSLIISETLESIEWGAFENCDNLTLYVFPDSSGEQYAKDNNLKFRYLADSVFVTLTVKASDGSVLTDGFTVEWYDESGAFVAEGTGVGLDKGGRVSYQVSLGEEFSFLYAQPEKQILELDADKTSAEAVYTLSALSAVAIRGRVIGENGEMIPGAAVTVKQTANQRYARTQSVTTDADGYYSADGFLFPTTVTVSADGYYTARKSFAVAADGQAYSAEDIVMTAVPENRFTLSLKRRDAAEKDGEPTLTTLSNADGLSFTVYNVTRDKEISGEVLQYPYLVLGSQAGAGDVIRVSVTDGNNAITMETTETVYGGEPNQALELTLVENGHIAASLSGSKRVRAMLFDGNGAFIRQYADIGAALDAGPLAADKYQIVFMENSSLLSAVPNLARLGQLGLENGKDYVLKSADVQNGVINNLGTVEVPGLDLQRFVIIEKAYTSVTVNKARVAAGQVVSIRVQYKLQSRYKDGTGQLILELPANCALLNGGVSVNGSGAQYALDRRTLKVNLANESGVVAVCVAPETAGNYTISCFLDWTMPDGVTTLQSVGSAFFEAYAMRINAPEKTSSPDIVVSGQSYSGGAVTLYDGGEALGSATVRAGGTWSVTAHLTDYFLYGFHDLYAVVETKDGRRAVSETRTVIYDSAFVDMDSITMLNNGQRVTLNLHDNASQAAYYSYNPSYPSFTFIMSPDKDAESLSAVHDVAVVTKDSEGAETRIPCQYQEGEGWVGSAAFSAEQAPVEAWAEYVCDTEKEMFNKRNAASLLEELAGAADELRKELQPNVSVGKTTTKNGLSSATLYLTTEDDMMGFAEITMESLSVPTYKLEHGYMVTEYVDVGKICRESAYIDGNQLVNLCVFPEMKALTRSAIDLSQLAILDFQKYDANDAQSILTCVKNWGMTLGAIGVTLTNSLTQGWYFWQGALENYQKGLSTQLEKAYRLATAKCEHGEYCLPAEQRQDMIQLLNRESWKVANFSDAAVGDLILCTIINLGMDLLIDKTVSVATKSLHPTWYQEFFLSGYVNQTIDDHVSCFSALNAADYADAEFWNISRELEALILYAKQNYQPCQHGCDGSSEDDTATATTSITLSPIIDPSGYVCEAVPSNRLEGVTATAWYRYENPETEEVETVHWDAAEYDQTNPLTTNAEGGYAWDVPVGEWQVRFEKDGYESAQSDWLPVPPPQTEVNIALVSKAAPTLSALSVYKNEARLEFSQYMKPETVTAERIRVTADGNAVSGTVQAVNLEASFDNPSISYASVYRFLTDQPLEGEIVVTVDAEVENYTGTVMQSDATATAVVERKPISLNAPKNVEISVGDTEIIIVKVLPEGAGANRKISVVSNAPDVISAKDGTTDASGTAQIPVSCLLPGSGELRFTLDGTNLTAVATVNYESVLESLDGEEIPPVVYALTVTGGTGSGEYEQDAEVTIKADEPTGETRFKEWIGTENLEFVNGDNVSMEATFKMPAKALTLTATYDEIPSYTVIWLNGDGSQLDSKTYKEGQTEPITDKVPTKAADVGNTYMFSKWDNGSTEGNVKTYKPEFTTTVKATQIETVSVSGQEIRTTISSSVSNAIIFCAIYNNSGKMISVRSVQITSESNYQFQFGGQQFDYAKVFIVDSNFCPLCKSKRS